MKTIEEFQQYYETGLRPVLETLEARRKKIRRTFLYIVLGAAAAVAVLAAATQPGMLLVGAIAVAIVAAVSWWLLTKDFIPEFKTRVVGSIASFIDPSLRYAPKLHITEGQFRESKLFTQSPDRFSGEDHVSGRIGATAIEFSEVHAEYKTTTTDSKGRTTTHWHTIFKGLFVIADFNKDFRTSTVVVPDTAERLFGRFGQWLQKMNVTRPGRLIKLEDPEFERMFAVYGEDQVEARYILSPGLMSRITDFAKATGKPLHLSFVGSNVHVAIPSDENMFEPRIFRTVLDFELARDYFVDLGLALSVVDELNLNTRVWSKE